MIKEKEYYTTFEAAIELHVSVQTVVRWAEQGLLPMLKTIGGRRRLEAEGVHDLWQKMQEKGKPHAD